MTVMAKEKYASLRKVDPEAVRRFVKDHPGLTLREIAAHFSKRGKTISFQRIHQILNNR